MDGGIKPLATSSPQKAGRQMSRELVLPIDAIFELEALSLRQLNAQSSR